MAQEGIAELVNQQTWLDPIGDLLQRWIEQAYAAGGQTGERVKGILSGTWFGHPLHPAITDVPLGSWTATAALVPERILRSPSGWSPRLAPPSPA